MFPSCFSPRFVHLPNASSPFIISTVRHRGSIRKPKLASWASAKWTVWVWWWGYLRWRWWLHRCQRLRFYICWNDNVAEVHLSRDSKSESATANEDDGLRMVCWWAFLRQHSMCMAQLARICLHPGVLRTPKPGLPMCVEHPEQPKLVCFILTFWCQNAR